MLSSVIGALALLVTLFALGIYRTSQARKDGTTEEKLKQSEKVIENVEKANGAYDRLDDNERRRLRERYGRSE